MFLFILNLHCKDTQILNEIKSWVPVDVSAMGAMVPLHGKWSVGILADTGLMQAHKQKYFENSSPTLIENIIVHIWNNGLTLKLIKSGL